MYELNYFQTFDVPLIVTNSVYSEVPKELIQYLFSMAFYRGKVFGNDTAYMQVFNVRCEENDGRTLFIVSMEQENPDMTTVGFMSAGCEKWSGTIWLIESWNGNKENPEPDEHYITMLFPEEY